MPCSAHRRVAVASAAFGTVLLAVVAFPRAAEPREDTGGRKVVKVAKRSEVAAPLTTNYDKVAGFTPGGVDPDPRKVKVDTDTYSNEATDYRTYAPGLKGWKSVEQTAEFLEKQGSSLRVVAGAKDLVRDGTAPFQVVCNEVVGDADTPMLASFILPAGWKPTGRYPIVLTGNGYTVSNNTRLFRDVGPTDLFRIAGRSCRDSRSGALVVVVNCGGTEAIGLQPSAVRNIGRVIDRAAELGGDRRRVVFWGASRGGITALVWGANPLGLDYTALAVFAKVPAPAFGEQTTAPPSATPAQLGAFRTVFGPDGWRYKETPSIGDPKKSELCRRIMGYADPSEADAHSGLAYADKLAAAQKAGKLRFVVTSYGSKDEWLLYAPAHRYHQALASRGVPVTTYIGLGSGHGGAASLLEADLEAFVDDITQQKPVGWAPKAGRFYCLVDEERRKVTRLDPPATPFSARVPFRGQTGRPALIELVGAAGGEYTVTLSRKGTPVKTWSGKFGESETFAERFTIPAAGEYDWSFTWKGKAVTRTPVPLPDGRAPPLTLTATEEQPPLDKYFVDPKRARAFGVDEIDPGWEKRQPLREPTGRTDR